MDKHKKVETEIKNGINVVSRVFILCESTSAGNSTCHVRASVIFPYDDGCNVWNKKIIVRWVWMWWWWSICAWCSLPKNTFWQFAITTTHQGVENTIWLHDPNIVIFSFDSFAYYSLRRFWIITVVASVLIFDPKSNSLFTNCVFQHLSMHEKRKAITRYITLSWSPKNHKLPYNGILLKFNIVLNFRIKELCMSARSSNWSNLGSKLLSVMPTIFSNQWQTVQRKLIFTPKNKY